MATYITMHPDWAMVMCLFLTFLCIGFGVATLVAFKLKRFFIKPSLERDRLAIEPPKRPAPIVVVLDERKDEPEEEKEKKKKREVKKKPPKEVNFVERNKKEALEAAEKKRLALVAAGAIKTKKKTEEKKPVPPPEPPISEEERKAREEEETRRKEEQERKDREAIMKISFGTVTSAKEMAQREADKERRAEEERQHAEEREERRRKREEALRKKEEALTLQREAQKRIELEQEKQRQAEIAQQKEEDRKIKYELRMAQEEGRDPDPDLVPAAMLVALGYTHPDADSDSDYSDSEAIVKQPSEEPRGTLTEADKEENLKRNGSAYPVLPRISQQPQSESESDSDSSEYEYTEDEVETSDDSDDSEEGVDTEVAAVTGAAVGATITGAATGVAPAKKPKKKKKVKVIKVKKQKKTKPSVAPGGAVAIATGPKLKKAKKGKAKKNSKKDGNLVIFGDEVDVDKKQKNVALEKERTANMKKIDLGMGVEMYTDTKSAKKVKTLQQVEDERRQKEQFKRSKTMAQLDHETQARLSRFKTMGVAASFTVQKAKKRMSEADLAAAERQRIADLQAQRFRQLDLGWTQRIE